LLHAAALALSGLAVAGVVRTSPPPRPSPAGSIPRIDDPARPARWAVKVDGWTIEVDGVAGVPFPAAEAVIQTPALLSPYDRMIARHADAAGFDWRFVAALIYEESRFDASSVSDAGAYGLMQVRPIAARDVGELFFREPEANVRTGVRYLQRLQREYQPARDRDRDALMLAAYNMGMGHVRDAQRLAQRFGYDPLRWDGSMDVMVSLLEEPAVHASLPNGYAQGRSVVGYVDRVLNRYAAYRRQLPAVPPHRAAAADSLSPVDG
jgi:membrane-bound lytic murein transglycosylase MltF